MSLNSDKSIAILIGVTEFYKDSENLMPLPEVRNNVDDLQELFLDRERVVAEFTNVTTLLNKPSSEIGHVLVQAAESALDTLFIYYAGHGLVRSGKFYLTGTDSIEKSINFSGIEFEEFRKAMNTSSAKRKILILDACFSGRAVPDMSSESGVIEANIDGIRGGFILASAGKSETSIAVSQTGRRTGFTDVVLTVLERGAETGKNRLTLNDFWIEINKEVVRRPGLPKPLCRFSPPEIAQFELFYNCHYVNPNFALQSDFIRLIERVDRIEKFLSETVSRLSDMTDEKKDADEAGANSQKLDLQENQTLVLQVLFPRKLISFEEIINATKFPPIMLEGLLAELSKLGLATKMPPTGPQDYWSLTALGEKYFMTKKY